MRYVDLNCDLGESLDTSASGADAELMAQVSSINVACGFHAGNPSVMEKTVRLAKQNGVAVGAHPGFPDLQGFGRRDMDMTPDEIYACVLYQAGALQAFLKAEGMSLQHVKPHGSMYNMAAVDQKIAYAIGKAIKSLDPSIVYCGLAGSQMAKAAANLDLLFAHEVFADRAYQPDGTLVPRSQSGAMIEDVDEAAFRVLRMVKEGKVTAIDGSTVAIKADTICIHGDSIHAITFATSIRAQFEAEGIQLRSMAQVW